MGHGNGLSPFRPAPEAKVVLQQRQNPASQFLRRKAGGGFHLCVQLCLLREQEAGAVPLRFPPVGPLDGLAEHGLGHVLRPGTALQGLQKKTGIGDPKLRQRGPVLHIAPVHFRFDQYPREPVIGSLPLVPRPGIEQVLQRFSAEKGLRQPGNGVHVQGVGDKHRGEAIRPRAVPHLIQGTAACRAEFIVIHRSNT